MRRSSAKASVLVRAAGLFFDNPVLRQQLVERLRSPDTAWIHISLLIALSAGLLVTWPADLMDPLSLVWYGQRIRALLNIALYAYISVAVPVLGAPLLAGEKERGSYDLLLTAPLSPSRLLVGKLAMPIAYGVIVLVSAAPFSVALLLTGGVAWYEPIGDFLLLLCLLTALTAGTILCSALVSTSRTALLLSLALSLGLAPIGGLALWTRTIKGAGANWLLGIVFAGTLVLVVAVVLHLRQRILHPPDRDVTAVDPDEGKEAEELPPLVLTLDRSRFPDKYIVPPRWSERSPLRGNPLYEKMVRVELFGRGTGVVRWLIQISCFVSVPIMAFALIINADYYHVYFVFLILYAVLVAGAIGGASIASEHEQGTAELIRATCLRYSTVLFGKWLGTVRLTLALLALVTVVQVGVPALIWGFPVATLYALCTLVIVLFAMFVASVAVLLSALVRRTVWAQLLVYFSLFPALALLGYVRERTPRLLAVSPSERIGISQKAVHLADLFSPANMVYVMAARGVRLSMYRSGPVLRPHIIPLLMVHAAIAALVISAMLLATWWLIRRRWGPE